MLVDLRRRQRRDPGGARQRALEPNDAGVGATRISTGRRDHGGQLLLQLLSLLLLLLGLLLLGLEVVSLLLKLVALLLQLVALLLQRGALPSGGRLSAGSGVPPDPGGGLPAPAAASPCCCSWAGLLLQLLGLSSQLRRLLGEMPTLPLERGELVADALFLVAQLGQPSAEPSLPLRMAVEVVDPPDQDPLVAVDAGQLTEEGPRLVGECDGLVVQRRTPSLKPRLLGFEPSLLRLELGLLPLERRLL